MVAIFADSNRARMRYIKSVDGWGTVPANGRTRELRYTGSSMNAAKETAVSEEIRADRMVSDIVEVAANTAGDVQIEFSAGSHDDFLESFMMGAWSRPMSFDSAKGQALEIIDADTIYVKGADVSDLFFVGRRVRLEGFVNPANNAYGEISAIAFDAGNNRTEITLAAGAALAAERGTLISAMFDANDVIVLNNDDIRFGTNAGEIDSNGTDAFASAIAAGNLLPGQKVFIETILGAGSGTVTLSANPAGGSRIAIADGAGAGAKTLNFQFGGVASQTAVMVALGADEDETAANLATAINTQRTLGNIAASASAALGVVTVRNLNGAGGSITEISDTGAAIAVVTFANGQAIRGVYTLQTVTDDVLAVTPAVPVNANAGSAKVTIKGSMLRNPSRAEDIVPQDYVIETGFEDVSQYFIADGQRVGGFSYDFSSNAILTGSFTFMGRGMIRQGTTKLGDDAAYTILPTTDTKVANSTVNVGAIVVDGEELSTALQSINLTGDNALRNQNAVGYKFPAGIGAGRMEISGSVNAYFADGSLWDRFIEHKTVALTFPLTDGERHHYEFTIPAVVFSTDNVNPAGGNQDIMESMEWTAKRDAATGCQIQIDRFSCIAPVTA